MRYLILLIITSLFISCKKGDMEFTPASQIDYIVLSLEAGFTDHAIHVRYNKEGKIVQFGNEAYSYNASGKVGRITVKPDYSEGTEGGLKSYFFDLSYDGWGRLKTVSDIKFETSGYGTILRPDSRSHTLSYEGDSRMPLQAVYAPIGRFSDVFTFEHDGRNIIKTVKATEIVDEGPWISPGSGDIESTTRYTHDSQPNVYRLLFGTLGFIPEVLLRPDMLDGSFFYSENNVTAVIIDDDTSRSVAYSYDDTGRVTEIRTDFGAIKIHYK